MLLSVQGSCAAADWVQESRSASDSLHDLLQTTYLWGQDTLCERGSTVLPLIIRCLQILGKDCRARSLLENLKGPVAQPGLGLAVGGQTGYPLHSRRHSNNKNNQQTPPSVWLKMKRYLQFLNIYSICFGYNLLRLLKVKPKEVIRISCRWSSVMFCEMKFISSTWNHTPQPVHCMNGSCNRN